MEWTEIERTYLTESWESNLEKKHFPACNFIQKLQAKLYPSEHCYLKDPQLGRDDFFSRRFSREKSRL